MHFSERSVVRIKRGVGLMLYREKEGRKELRRVEREEVVFRSAVCWSRVRLSERLVVRVNWI